MHQMDLQRKLPRFSLGRRRLWLSALLVAAIAGLVNLGGQGPRSDAAEPAPFVPTAAPAAPITAINLQQRMDAQVKPLLVKHCYACHANGKKKGDVVLDPYTSLASVQSARDKWLHISETLKQ